MEKQPYRVSTALRSLAEMAVAEPGHPYGSPLVAVQGPRAIEDDFPFEAVSDDCRGRELEKGDLPADLPRAQVVGPSARIGVSRRNPGHCITEESIGPRSLLRASSASGHGCIRSVHGQRDNGWRGPQARVHRNRAMSTCRPQTTILASTRRPGTDWQKAACRFHRLPSRTVTTRGRSSTTAFTGGDSCSMTGSCSRSPVSPTQSETDHRGKRAERRQRCQTQGSSTRIDEASRLRLSG